MVPFDPGAGTLLKPLLTEARPVPIGKKPPVAQSPVEVIETKRGRVPSVFRLYKAAIICRARIESDAGLTTITKSAGILRSESAWPCISALIA